MSFRAGEYTKRRLTSRSELSIAVMFLLQHGLDRHEIAMQLVRFYYVDVDLLNEVLDTVACAAMPQSGTGGEQAA